MKVQFIRPAAAPPSERNRTQEEPAAARGTNGMGEWEGAWAWRTYSYLRAVADAAGESFEWVESRRRNSALVLLGEERRAGAAAGETVWRELDGSGPDRKGN